MQKQVLSAIIAVIIVVIGIYAYTQYSNYYPSTDDAYVQADIVNIAAQVSGPVKQIFVQDHQQVKIGQPLFTIDPTPFQISLQQAQATVAQTQAELDTQSKDTARILELVQEGQLPKANGDDAQGKLDELTAALKVAQAQLAQAQLNLQYTTINAPANGYLNNFTLRTGQIIQAGSLLFALVETDQWWVNANFKETDLARIHVGQFAKIVLDIYPDITFKGIVQGISAGSGAAFALLPPENATGNWVKVTQRFPVRINFVHPDSNYPLRVGASSTVTVSTR
jgi:membrane fusion protein (multidrug efflux system)